MKKVDAHQHFWKYNPVRDNWITEEMAVIQKDFLPADLAPVLKENNIDGCVVVQSDQSEQENMFQLANADAHDFIKGIVGWVDLQDKRVEERLEYYSGFKKMKGFRHVLQGESKRDLMLAPAFQDGIFLLSKYGFTYDILVYPDQLRFVHELVSSNPDQKFVIDHMAKPYIKFRNIKQWKEDMETIATYDNVYCKVSGLVTEADWTNWKKADILPYIDVVVESYGLDRIMFGSDWPVCLVAASYEEVADLVKEYFAAFSEEEQDKFFGLNAIQFYNL